MWGLAIVAFGFCTTLWPALAWLMLTGAADAISGIFRMTMWNQTIPDSLRGRLAGIAMVSYTSGPLLGHVEAGAVAAVFGVPASVISGGALCVIGVMALHQGRAAGLLSVFGICTGTLFHVVAAALGLSAVRCCFLVDCSCS